MKRTNMIPFLILLLVFCISGCGQESRSRETEETVQAAERNTTADIETEAQISMAENMEQEWVQDRVYRYCARGILFRVGPWRTGGGGHL